MVVRRVLDGDVPSREFYGAECLAGLCSMVAIGSSHLQDHHVRERPEMFLQGDTVRPGVLTLVNDTDWELCGGAEYEVQPGDNLTFISTLHGG
mmetsp:Transcript_9014/g.17641  ORF Transcript_9014/g.17641 Transcript_9014/m.17641 type:complete len:93 (-) Transcript_9014:85-363(-)